MVIELGHNRLASEKHIERQDQEVPAEECHHGRHHRQAQQVVEKNYKVPGG